MMNQNPSNLQKVHMALSLSLSLSMYEVRLSL